MYAILVAPLAVHAQTFAAVVGKALDFINILVGGVFALTFIYVIWGLTNAWIIKGGTEDGVKEGNQVAFNGIIGLVVMASIWGIVALLREGVFGF